MNSLEQKVVGLIVLKLFFWVFAMFWASWSLFPWVREYLLIIFR